MDARKAKQLLPVITAFANGSKIQVLDRLVNRWVDISEPLWCADSEDYRVKPKSELSFTADQIQQLRELRRDAVSHINGSDYHLSVVDFLADKACIALGIDADDRPAANIVKSVVKHGTCAETVATRIQVAKANREFHVAADNYEDEPSC